MNTRIRNLLCTCLACVLALQAQAAPTFRTALASDGREYVPLRNLAKTYGLEYANPSQDEFVLKSRWTHLTFHNGGRKMVANGLQLWLLEPVASIRKRPAVGLADARLLIDPLLCPDDYLPRAGHQTILLDPGHGGRDPGTRSKRGTEEKDITLDIAVHARKILANAGYRVYLSRENDRYLSLDERCAKARACKADVFVSIHLNSAANRTSSGRETFVLTPSGHQSTNDQGRPDRTQRLSHPGNRNDAANIILGYFLQKHLMKTIPGVDRGLRRARFQVLKNAPCPAALVECGFLSNADEDQQFSSIAYRRQAAHALANGIMDYLSAVQRAKAATPDP